MSQQTKSTNNIWRDSVIDMSWVYWPFNMHGHAQDADQSAVVGGFCWAGLQCGAAFSDCSYLKMVLLHRDEGLGVMWRESKSVDEFREQL